MDFFDFAPKTDEELAATTTEGGDIDADLATKTYDIRDSLEDGDTTLLEKDNPQEQEKVIEAKVEKSVETAQEISDLNAFSSGRSNL